MTSCLNERRLEAPCYTSMTPAPVSIGGRSAARRFGSGVPTRARACTRRLPACGLMDFMSASVITVVRGTVCSWCRSEMDPEQAVLTALEEWWAERRQAPKNSGLRRPQIQDPLRNHGTSNTAPSIGAVCLGPACQFRFVHSG